MSLARRWLYTCQTSQSNKTQNFKKLNKMKNITKVLAIAVIALGLSNSSFAQATTSASASATIITPITITKTVDMNFGNIAVSATAGGTVVLAPGGSRSLTGTGLTLPATTGSVTAATFTVSGQSGYGYAITLPSSCTITDASSHTMTINAFTSNPSSTGTLSSGTSKLTVGATLTVSAAQAAGSYTNATGVPVTVNYN